MAIRNLAHAQRMLAHAQSQQAARDAREPPVMDTPKPDTAYLAWRRTMRDSDEIKHVAAWIANLHEKYEGWPQTWRKPSLIHLQATELAVRWSSPEARSAATTALENYMLTALERLEERSRSCDMTRVGLEWERKYIARTAMEVFMYHLLHESGRSHHEMLQLEDTSLEDPDV